MRAELLLLLAAAAAALSPRRAAAAVAFEPAVWNSYAHYEADNVPARLLLPQGPQQSGPVLFPLDGGWNVQSNCYGPDHPAPNPDALKAPGACKYERTGGSDKYRFMQKLPTDRLRLSNCYCYATDYREGAGWCMPGVGGGLGELAQDAMSCAELSRRVVADGAAPVSRDVAVQGPTPSDGHYIALMFRPMESCNFPRCGPDFHVLRRDASGFWSHKVGDGPATDRDAGGKQITDPQAAQLEGAFTQLCGYFQVTPSKSKVTASRGPDRITNLMRQWRDAGLAVRVSNLPYNPDTDFVGTEEREQLLLRMMRAAQQGKGGARRLLRGGGVQERA